MSHERELGKRAKDEIEYWYKAGSWAAKVPELFIKGREGRVDRALAIAREIRRGSFTGTFGGPDYDCVPGSTHPLCKWASGASAERWSDQRADLLAKEPDERIREMFEPRDCDNPFIFIALKYKIDNSDAAACSRWLQEGLKLRDERFDDYAPRVMYLLRRAERLDLAEEQIAWIDSKLSEDENLAIQARLVCDKDYDSPDCQYALARIQEHRYVRVELFLVQDESCGSVDRVLSDLFEHAEYHSVAVYQAGRCLSHGRGTIRDRRRGLALLRYGALQRRFGGAPSYARALLEPPYSDLPRAYFWAVLAQDDELTAAIAEKLPPSTADEIEQAARRWASQRAARNTAAAVDYLGIARVEEMPVGKRQGGAGPQSSGTVFVIAPSIVATAAHVVAGCAHATTEWGDATIVHTDEATDVALLRVGAEPPALPFRAARPSIGEQVVVLGYPIQGLGAVGLNASTGVVSALTGPRGMTRMIQISAQVQPGSSGGPVLDASGRLVGLVVSTLQAEAAYQQTGTLPQNVNFAVRASVLEEALDAAGIPAPEALESDGDRLAAEQLVAQARASVSQIRCGPDAPAEN